MENEVVKKNGWKTACIVIAVVAVVGIIAAIFVPSLIKKEEDKEPEKKEEKKEEPLTKDSAVVQDLFEFFREDKDDYDFKVAEAMDYFSYYKYYYTMKSIEESKFEKVNCSDLTEVYVTDNDTSGEYIYALCGDGDNILKLVDNDGGYKTGSMPTQDQARNLLGDAKTDAIKASVFDNQFNKYFGKNAHNKNDFEQNPLGVWHYDTKKDLYALFLISTGEEVADGIKNQTIDSIKEENGHLFIITKATAKWDGSEVTITYEFKKEESTGNYIWMSRETDNTNPAYVEN